MIGYSQNFLISQWKGVTQNVYSKRYPYTFAESIFIHQSRQRTGPLVHLYHFGIHHPFYLPLVYSMPIRLTQVGALECDPAHVRLPSDSVGVSGSFP